MSEITYETDYAAFSFPFKTVKEKLKEIIKEHNVSEAHDIYNFISSSTTNTIRLNEADHPYFGFIALNLIKEGIGTSYCKACDKTYQNNQLKPFKLGLGEYPYDPDYKPIWSFKALFMNFKDMFKKKMRMPGSGGKGYKCPEEHVLIAGITWIT